MHRLHVRPFADRTKTEELGCQQRVLAHDLGTVINPILGT